MRADWKKDYTMTRIGYECEKVIGYVNPKYPELEIQSRTESIPHANGEGTWKHTSYVLVRGYEELTFRSLGDAIEWVEGTRVPEVSE